MGRRRIIISRMISLVMAGLMVFANSLPAGCEARTEAEEPVVVSLGDSYSSGEGIEPFYGQLDKNGKERANTEKVGNPDWMAHRSTKAWPGMLSFDNGASTMADYRGKNWFFVAASGAETKHLYKTQKKTCISLPASKLAAELPSEIGAMDLSAQLDVFSSKIGKGKTIGEVVDYVTITMGGNDLDFAGIISTTVTDTRLFGYRKLEDKLNHAQKMLDKGIDGEESLRKKLKSAYEKIHKKIGKDATILVVGYPSLLDEKNTERAVITATEAHMINEKVHYFNSVIEEIVIECKREGMRIEYVSVEDEFGTEGQHGAYAEEPWINPVFLGPEQEDLDCLTVASSYSIHPNEKGAEAYAKCVQKTIDLLEGEKQVQEEQEQEKQDPPEFKTGDKVIYGRYEQDNDSGNGAEPIEWTVLDQENGKLLMISDHSLDCKKYDDGEGNTWDKCSLRSWLNKEFYETAFSEVEKKSILTSEVTADVNPNYDPAAGIDFGSDTQDKVFLLSGKEAETYFKSDEERICKPTDYARFVFDRDAEGDDRHDPGSPECWWLRSTSDSYGGCATIVNWEGGMCYDAKAGGAKWVLNGVRPVMWVKWNSLMKKPGSDSEASEKSSEKPSSDERDRATAPDSFRAINDVDSWKTGIDPSAAAEFGFYRNIDEKRDGKKTDWCVFTKKEGGTYCPTLLNVCHRDNDIGLQGKGRKEAYPNIYQYEEERIDTITLSPGDKIYAFGDISSSYIIIFETLPQRYYSCPYLFDKTEEGMVIRKELDANRIGHESDVNEMEGAVITAVDGTPAGQSGLFMEMWENCHLRDGKKTVHLLASEAKATLQIEYILNGEKKSGTIELKDQICFRNKPNKVYAESEGNMTSFTIPDLEPGTYQVYTPYFNPYDDFFIEIR